MRESNITFNGTAYRRPLVRADQEGESMKFIRMLSQIIVCGALVPALAGCFAGAPTDRHAETMKGAPTHSTIGYPKTISASHLNRVRDGWKKQKEWHGQPLKITGGAGHGS